MTNPSKSAMDGKPDDVSQAAWDKALYLVDDYDMLLAGRAFAAVVLRIAKAIDAATKAAFEEAEKAINNERLGFVADETDAAYMRAISHCEDAIRKLGSE